MTLYTFCLAISVAGPQFFCLSHSHACQTRKYTWTTFCDFLQEGQKTVPSTEPRPATCQKILKTHVHTYKYT